MTQPQLITTETIWDTSELSPLLTSKPSLAEKKLSSFLQIQNKYATIK